MLWPMHFDKSVLDGVRLLPSLFASGKVSFEVRQYAPDIQINDHKMSKVVVECALGGDNDKDAKKRIKQGYCSTAIAVSIPAEFEQLDVKAAEQKLCKKALFEYALLQQDRDGELFRFPETGYTKGSARGLAALIQAASVPKSRVEQVAEEVAELIDKAVEALSLWIA